MIGATTSDMGQIVSWSYIDHILKWQRFCYSFVFMLIRPTGLVLVYTFFWILPMHGSEVSKTLKQKKFNLIAIMKEVYEDARNVDSANE